MKLGHRFPQADRRCCFAFSGGCGVDGSDKDQLAVRLPGEALPDRRGELRFIAAIGLELFLADSEPLRNLRDWQKRGVLCDFNVSEPGKIPP